MNKFQNIPKPQGKGRLSTNDILGGQITPAIERMRSLSEDEFEDLVLEWADGFLNNKYDKIRQYGGSGDKGRDIVGFYQNEDIDIYQCKHYSAILSPALFWVELGKLCHYTFTKQYKIPKAYYIVTTKGVGPKLLDYINNPTEFNDLLISEWEDKCESKIKSTKTILTKAFKKYIENFDFSIIKDKSPLELINEHKQTTYYPQRFGGGLIKYRNLIPKPTKTIQKHELNYTTLLFDAYSTKTGVDIKNQKELETTNKDLAEHFEEERTSFYCTESLDRFSRDNFADLATPPFEELKEDSLLVIKSKLRLSTYIEAFERLEDAKLEILSQQFTSNPLHKEIRNLDKVGMCHYLANEKSVKWKK